MTKNKIRECITNLLIPQHCLVCHEVTRHGSVCRFCLPKLLIDFEWRCQICFAELPFITNQSKLCTYCSYKTEQFNSIRYIWDYSGQSRNFIRTMKYKALTKLVAASAAELSNCWSLLFYDLKPDLIIPMPANYLRHKQRGFNQALLISRFLKKNLALEKVMIKDLLKASIKRKAQADLSITARIKNMRSGFICRKGSLIKGRNILLVDDVITTGASIRSAISCLKGCGANNIDVLGLAVSPAFYRNRHRFLEGTE